MHAKALCNDEKNVEITSQSTPNSQQFIRSIFPISQNIWDILKKSSNYASLVHATSFRKIHFNRISCLYWLFQGFFLSILKKEVFFNFLAFLAFLSACRAILRFMSHKERKQREEVLSNGVKMFPKKQLTLWEQIYQKH